MFFWILLLVPSLSFAADTPVTAESMDLLSLEVNSIIASSAAALSFFLGWVAGASS